MKNDEEVVQIVIASLKPGASTVQFVALTKQMKEWFLVRDGFVSYEFYRGGENIADKIVWKNAEYAQQINREFLTSDIFRQMEPLLDSNYSGFTGKRLEL